MSYGAFYTNMKSWSLNRSTEPFQLIQKSKLTSESTQLSPTPYPEDRQQSKAWKAPSPP